MAEDNCAGLMPHTQKICCSLGSIWTSNYNTRAIRDGALKSAGTPGRRCKKTVRHQIRPQLAWRRPGKYQRARGLPPALTRAVADLLRSATSGSRPRSTSDQIERMRYAVSVRQASGCRRSHRHVVCLLDRLVRGKRFGEILSHLGWHVHRTSDVSFCNNAPRPDQAVIRPSSDQPHVMARRAGDLLKTRRIIWSGLRPRTHWHLFSDRDKGRV
jgi:hypothetical protein